MDFNYENFNENDIEKYNRCHWQIISTHKYLTEEFIDKYKDYLDWLDICFYQNLSEKFIENHEDYVQWHYISRCQNLSKGFILKHMNDLNHLCLFDNDRLKDIMQDDEIQIYIKLKGWSEEDYGE